MIKTIQYNDFSTMDYEVRKDFTIVLEMFRDFVKKGGNLDLPVSPSKEKVTSFEEWMKTNYSNHPEYFKQLIDEKLITNPFNFIVDHENKTIRDIPGYGLHWLSYNDTRYSKYINDAVEKLAIEIKDWPIDSKQYIYENYDYNNDVVVDKNEHPLKLILKRLDSNENFKSIFNINENYASLWTQKDISRLCKFDWGRLENKELAYHFFNTTHGKNSILTYQFDNQKAKNQTFHELISYAITKNDINFIDSNFTDKKIQEIEQSKESDEVFIMNSQSEEMTELLIKKGVFVSGYFKNGDKETSCIHSEISIGALKTLLKKDKNLTEMVTKNPNYYYNMFLNVSNNNTYRNKDILPIIQLLVEEYKFPLSNYETLPFVYAYSNHTNSLKETFTWFINHGMNPMRCKHFITSCVSNRGDGLKTLKALQKENYFNSFYPDPIFNILSENPTKDFTKWLEKAPSEFFSRHTVNGLPAWWGAANGNTLDLIQSKEINFIQNSNNGLSLFYYLFKNPRRTSYDTSGFNLPLFTSVIQKKLSKQTHNLYDLSGTDHLGKNLFHYLLTYDEYKSKDMPEPLVNLMLTNTNSNIGTLLLAKDNDGIKPLGLMLETHEKVSNHYSVSKCIKSILESSVNNIEWDDKITYKHTDKDKKSIVQIEITAYDAFIIMAEDNKELKENIYKSYDTWKLYHKLNDNLSTPKKEKKSLKI